jgi:hypothetical protein
LNERKERIAELERDRYALVEPYARMTPEGMDPWSAEERHRVYQPPRLQVYAAPGESTEVNMLLDYTANLEATLYSVKTANTSMSVRTANLQPTYWSWRPALQVREGLALLVYEGLAQIEYGRGPQPDEDRRLPPPADVQRKRDQDRNQGSANINAFVHDLPPLFGFRHYTCRRKGKL